MRSSDFALRLEVERWRGAPSLTLVLWPPLGLGSTVGLNHLTPNYVIAGTRCVPRRTATSDVNVSSHTVGTCSMHARNFESMTRSSEESTVFAADIEASIDDDH